MHPRQRWSRSLAGVMTVWFGLVMAAPAVLHSCPRAMANIAAADAGDAHAAHRPHHSGHQDQDPPADCQCLGSCALSASPALTASSTLTVAVLAPVSDHALFATAEAATALPPDHLQPFATAPPLRLG